MLAGSRSAQFGSLRSGAKSGNVFLGREKNTGETRAISKDLTPREGDW